MATALQKTKIKQLYRTSLKQLLSWVISREVFYTEVRGGRVAVCPPYRCSSAAAVAAVVVVYLIRVVALVCVSGHITWW